MTFVINQELLDKHILKIDQIINLNNNDFKIFELLDKYFSGHDWT